MLESMSRPDYRVYAYRSHPVCFSLMPFSELTFSILASATTKTRTLTQMLLFLISKGMIGTACYALLDRSRPFKKKVTIGIQSTTVGAKRFER